MAQAIISQTKERQFKIVLMFLLLFVFLIIGYGVEFYLAYEEYERELGTNERIRMAAKRANVPFDPRTVLQVIEDIRKEGKKAWSPLAPQLFVETDGIEVRGKKIFPLASISRTTQVFCNEMGEYSIYDSDEYGFNNPLNQWKKNKVDIALIGDSFVHGACVKPGDDMAGQLRKLGLKTLNMGIGSTGSPIYNAVVREYAAPMQPKYVLWFHYGVDIRDALHEMKSPTLVKYIEEENYSQNLISRGPELDVFLEEFYQTEYQKKLDEWAKNRVERKKVVTKRIISQALVLHKVRQRIRQLGRPVVYEGYEEQKLDAFKRSIVAAKKKTESWGGKFVFVFLPDWYNYGAEVDSYGIKIDANFLLRQDVLKIVKELNIPIVDIQADVFDKHSDPVSLYNFRTYGHYTLEGYTLVVREIEKYLKKNAKNIFPMKTTQR